MRKMASYAIPSHANQILTVSRYELLMFLRGKKIFGILAITIAISALFIAIFEFAGTLEEAFPLDFDFSFPISSVFFLIVLLAAFFGSGSIVSEFHQKTGQMFFANPVSRTTIWFGKFLAAEMISIAILILYYSIMIGYAVSNSYEIPVELGGSLLFSFLSLTMILSMAFLISSALRGPTGSAVLVFALFIFALPLADGFLMTLVDFKPWFTPTFSSGIIEHSLIVPYPDDISDPSLSFSFISKVYIPQIAQSVMVMVAYIVVAAISSIYIFKKRELT